MTPAETITILRLYNEWRQGGFDLPQPDPNQITAAIDAAVEMIERLEAAEKERDTLRTAVRHESDCVEAAKAEIKALRAKITEMEKQEPVGTALLCTRCSTPFDGDHYCPACGYHTATEKNVYALPGAQPAPSIPEGWKLVPIEPTEEMTTAFARVFNVRDQSGTFTPAFRAALAAAPEIKP